MNGSVFSLTTHNAKVLLSASFFLPLPLPRLPWRNTIQWEPRVILAWFTTRQKRRKGKERDERIAAADTNDTCSPTKSPLPERDGSRETFISRNIFPPFLLAPFLIHPSSILPSFLRHFIFRRRTFRFPLNGFPIINPSYELLTRPIKDDDDDDFEKRWRRAAFPESRVNRVKG